MPQDSQLLTHDSFPLGVLATGDSRSFHERYLVSIRRLPSCTPLSFLTWDIFGIAL